MPLILNIETATKVCSVSLAKGNTMLSNRISYEDKSHSELVTVFVQQIIEELQIDIKTIDAVAVSKGPGSYTGLRIGVSAAKGIAYGIDKPLISVNTLQTMVCMVLNNNDFDKNTLFCPMIDARRMEVYTAVYDINCKQIREIKAEIIDENSFNKLLDNNKVVFFGDGANKCKNTILHENAIFIDDITPLSNYMVKLAFENFKNKQFEDVAYFEPFYLKDFVATKPKKYF